MSATAMWVIGQTIVIVLAVVASHVRRGERITRLETQIEYIVMRVDGLASDHSGLGRQVQGISRAVARLQGAIDVPLEQHISDLGK